MALKDILRAAMDPANKTQPVVLGPMDFSRPFLPEEYTQLFYTPIYQDLTDVQRLRYNQLSGVRVNEFIMTLEKDLLERMLLPLRTHARVVAEPELGQCLEIMIEEERRHYAGFAKLNRHCLPAVFVGGRERYFTELSWMQDRQFALLGRLSRAFPFPLYSLMALEESSMSMARRMIHHPATLSLGELEPQFVAVHREHMKDEGRHVAIQERLIEVCLTQTGRFSRWSNSRLFKSMLTGLTAVGRTGSGAKVIRHLVSEHPELAPREDELVNALTTLRQNAEYQRSLFNRKAMPHAFGVFDQTPEFEDLSTYMVGYERH